MEAPEKIYISFDKDITSEVLSQKVEGDIEYVRTDAFIEKACDWWADNFEYTDDVDVKYKNIRDFKNYMKGE